MSNTIKKQLFNIDGYQIYAYNYDEAWQEYERLLNLE